MPICRVFRRVVLVGWVIVLFPAASLMAQTLHSARACAVRFQGPCSAWDAQPDAPSQADPLLGSVHDHESGNGTCAFPFPNNVWLDSAVQVDRPFDLVGTAQPEICAASGVDGDTRGTAEYFLDDGQFLFTRTDQPASPGETVSVRLRAEYMFIHEPTLVPVTPDIGNDWNQHFSLDMWFGGNGLGSPGVVQNVLMRENGEGSPIPPAESGGWLPVNNTGLLTVPLNTPVAIDVSMLVSMSDRYDTCPSCQGIGRYEAANTMGLRLAQQPFTFSGPGTYTVSALPLLIYSNLWPVVAVIDENSTQEELDALTVADGHIIVEGPAGTGCLSFANLTQVTGSVFVQGGPAFDACLDMQLANLEGDFQVNNHQGAVNAQLGGIEGNVQIESTGGDVNVTVAGDILGDLVVSEPDGGGRPSTFLPSFQGSASLVTVSLNGTSIGGRISLVGVGPTTLNMPGVLTVGGDLEADNISQSLLDLSQTSVGGRTLLTTRDTPTIHAKVAALETDLRADFQSDGFELHLPADSVATDAPLTLQRLGGAEIEWQAGLKPDGSTGVLDPYAMFSVNVGGTLSAPATVAMRMTLSNLASSELTRITTAVADGRLTLARRPTNAIFASLPICPTAVSEIGCAALIPLDSNDQPTTLELATSLKLSTHAVEFSDWALVVIASRDEVPAVSTWGLTILALLLMTWGTLVCLRRSSAVAQSA